MKKYQLLLLPFILVIQSVKSQSFGIGATAGKYIPKYSSVDGSDQTVIGKSSLGISTNLDYPISASGTYLNAYGQFNFFSTEQFLSNTESMSNNNKQVKLGIGTKQLFGNENNTIKPLLSGGISYEALIISNYYYSDQQSGKLDWKRNAYFDIGLGIGIETGLNSRIDLGLQYSYGLLNRIDATNYGTYKDQFLGAFVNINFN